jgi:diaminopimelate epimerase
MRFAKYQALGNDYVVINPAMLAAAPPAGQVRLICDRHYGVGADGLLWGPLPSESCDFRLRLFNPDGAEFEKSGNGLRIFARYLWDQGLVALQPFTIDTPGGPVTCQVHPDGQQVTVAMGQISFHSTLVPVAGPPREVLNELLEVDGRRFRCSAATIGNPHCVVLDDAPSPASAQRYGPLIERDARFPHRANVQFMQVLDSATLRIEIWERGAGYTLASGSSSCAAAAVAHRLELCGPQVTVQMPGGSLYVEIGNDWSVAQTGPAAKVFEGVLAGEVPWPGQG